MSLSEDTNEGTCPLHPTPLGKMSKSKSTTGVLKKRLVIMPSFFLRIQIFPFSLDTYNPTSI